MASYQELVTTFADFLTVCIHNILFERSIYPANSFLTARAYNYPVRQSRHPGVCQWIRDAVHFVQQEILKGNVQRVAVVLFSPQQRPLERFMFDLTNLPDIGPGEEHLPLGAASPPEQPPEVLEEEQEAPQGFFDKDLKGPVYEPPNVDLAEQFRAVLVRISGCGKLISPLPKGSSFTVAIELQEDANPPIGHPQPWIPVESSLQARQVSRGDEDPANKRSDDHQRGNDLGGARTTAIRAVDADFLAFDVWIEESQEKIKMSTNPSDKDPAAAKPE